MRPANAFLVTLLTLIPISAWSQERRLSDILNSSHNLAATSRGPVRSQRTDACSFCHLSHNNAPNVRPLWNSRLSTQVYNVYTSSTLTATPEQPTAGMSKLCLSCHDGTVALGATVALGMVPTVGVMAADSVLGSNLGNDHPVSFVPRDDGQLRPSLFQSPPSTGDPAVRLFEGRVECTSCHDPHSENLDAVIGKFLVRSNQSGALCLACHDPSRSQPNQLHGWTNGAHRTATHTAPATTAFGPYGNVAANACVNCHLDHNASSIASPRLLRGFEENACAQCHSGTNLSPALSNVVGEFTKSYSHPTVTVSGAHDANEDQFPLNSSRHAECVDCHNSHAASNAGGSATPPALQASLLGVSGVDATTGSVPRVPASNEYELCFKCHANSANKPQAAGSYAVYGRTPRRVTDDQVADPYNTRLEFNSSVSRHNVTNPRQTTGAQVPSLRASILTLGGASTRSLGSGTYLYCTDCHNNNQARASGGTGPNGPHGSNFPHLLERRYEMEPPPGSPGGPTSGVTFVDGLSGTAALCYKCHDLTNSILQDRSFKEHSKHVSGERASCSTCHAPHGINGGNSGNNSSLINFDLAMVAPDSTGLLRFEDTGNFSGRCYLTCHGVEHSGWKYEL